jgi:hypothetical protein
VKKAAAVMADAFETTTFKQPKVQVISNVTGKPVRGRRGRERLVRR